MNWYQIYSKHEDYKIYITEGQMKNYICANQKCGRLLKDIDIDFKYRRKGHNLTWLSSMGMRVISQSFFDVLQECAPNDFVTKKISGEKYILNVTSFAITNSKCIRTEGECPVCKNPFWKGFSQEKYFTGNYFFIKPQNEKTVLCRSSEILGDSYYAKYSLFCNEVLAEKLEKLFVNDVFLEKCLITPELTRNSV